MHIEQFFDKGLAHASYALINDGKMFLVDPARDPKQYYELAGMHNAKITGIIETHPHADFVSSHLEIHKTTGADIYVSKLLGADYPHKTFDEGDMIEIGNVTLKAYNTPGHSPDSISILVEEDGKQVAVFTGDTLFIGDVGRPDLREKAGNITAKREEMARDMYKSTREKLMKLQDDVIVYPAHGAGSLCGKKLSADLQSTIGREKRENWALQEMSEEEFVTELLKGQPFIPKYFGFDVSVNKAGAQDYSGSIEAVPRVDFNPEMVDGQIIVDTRTQEEFKLGHLKGAVNIPEDDKYETWLGAVVAPDEKFYLMSEDAGQLERMINQAAKIGYEVNILGAFVKPAELPIECSVTDVEHFKSNMDSYTIVDIRSEDEVTEDKYFPTSINIPLHELRERTLEIPTEKPVIVHCAGGYRSSIGFSITSAALKEKTDVYDLSVAVEEFKKQPA